MSDIFLDVVNSSLAAGWIVLVVLLLRWCLRKAPKWVTVLLWGIVAVRLICPLSIESAWSLLPSAETVSPTIMTDRVPSIYSGVPAINSLVNPLLEDVTAGAAVNPLQVWIPVLAVVWLVGVGAMLTYAVISYVRVKRSVGTAVLLRERIYQSERVTSPFVLGLWKPNVYLPVGIDEQEARYIIAHETAHIRRKDHWWKPIGFLILSFHWFHPLMWLAYVLLCRDIELACDEKVIRDMNVAQKADYSQALLNSSVHRRRIAACPLAFGEVGVKQRVTSVLHYKKPTVWIVAAALVLCAIVAVCFLTNPLPTTDRVLDRLLYSDDYEILSQHPTHISLSVPMSALPNDIYSDNGVTFEDEDITVYADGTTTVYLKEARYSNEGREALYFAFDCVYALPRERGTFLYPYELTEGGFSGAVKTVDGILHAANGAFAEAVHDRGLGAGERLWFYVSADALKQARSYARFDVTINRITYALDEVMPHFTWVYEPMCSYTGYYIKAFDFAVDYTHIEASCTAGELVRLDVAGEPCGTRMRFESGESVCWTPTLTMPPTSEITFRVYRGETLCHTYTVVFERGETDGITAEYIIRPKATDGLMMVESGGRFTVAEREAVSSVGGADPPVRVTVEPSLQQAVESERYSPVIDSAEFDIDGDGRTEQCLLRYGPTSGVFTFQLSVSEAGVLEYFSLFQGRAGEVSFVQTDGGVKLRLIPQGEERPIDYALEVKDDYVALIAAGETVGYWGEQGRRSPYAPTL